MNLARLTLANLRREWRLPELRTLALALALAVFALGLVATLAARVERGLVASAAELIGADLGLAAAQAAPPALATAARADGLATSREAGFPSVAFAGERNQMLDVLAVDGAWPLRGRLEVRGADGVAHAVHGAAPGTVWLDHRALVALGLGVGDEVQVGGSALRIAGELLKQPDGGTLIALAPRAVMALADAEAAGLLGPGSRVRHRLLVAGPAAALTRWQRAARAGALPAGAEWVSPAQAEERLRAAWDRAGMFLRLTALLAALLAGIAIALSARRHARRKASEVALLRALGTPRRRVLGLISLSLAALALPVALAGALATLGVAELAWRVLGTALGDLAAPLPWLPAFEAAGIGLVVLAAFALPPVARLLDVSPAAVFRQSAAPRPRRFDFLYLAPFAAALALIGGASDSLRMAAILAAALAGVAAASALVAWVAIVLLRRLAPGAHPALRLGLAALARRRGLGIVQACALALGLTALLLLSVVAPALIDGWRGELAPDTPNWFVLNLQDEQRADFGQELQALGADKLNMLPLATGKLLAINAVPVGRIAFADPRAKDWAERQLRLSWADALPEANTVIAGRWFDARPAAPEVSVDTTWRDRFALKLGDRLRLRVGERDIDARIGSFREVDWTSFRVNFFLLLDPAHASTLPHSWLASFHLPRERAAALATLARDRPNLSLISVDDILDRLRDIVTRVSAAVRWILVLSLVAGALVLAAALTASAAERRHEAALLRTLGAPRRMLRIAALCEFSLLGAIAGLTAALGAGGAGWWLGRAVFHLDGFVPPLSALAAGAAAAAVCVAVLGLVGTHQVSRTPPMRLLRQG